MARTRSIARRLVAAAAVWIAAALIVGGILLSNLFSAPLESAFEQRLTFLLETLIGATDILPDGRIAQPHPLGEPRFERQYSGLYWQIATAEGGRILARSRSMWDFEIDAAGRGGDGVQRYDLAGPLDQKLRVLARPVSEEGVAGRFMFAIAADTAELTDTISAFNRTLLWSLGALGIGLLIAVLVQVHFGLSPLKRLRRSLADIRAGRAERLEGDFPSEVVPLADELNGLLDHTRDVLARARAHVGNLAHALKTPISVLTNLGDGREADIAGTVAQQTEIMRRHVDHHLSRARAVGQAPLLRSQTELLPVMRSLARTLEKIHVDRDVKIAATGGDGLFFRGEQHDLEEMLGNLLDNACKWAKAEIRLAADATAYVGSGGMQIALTVDDDGPGVAAEKHDSLFARGERLDESTPGSGLGLAIVRDLAVLYGGDVALEESPLGGLRVRLNLPGGVAGDA